MPGGLARLTGSVFQDALALFLGVPPALAGTAFQSFMRRRADLARDALLDELRRGEIGELSVASENDAIGVIYRYFLAARDGAARRNLRLLAKVIVGLATRDRLYSEEFSKYANILSSLSRDQIFVAGRFFRLQQIQEEETTGAREGPDAWSALKLEMVSQQFETQYHLESICAQLSGAGLALQVTVYGGNAYRPSPILMEVGLLADFEGALDGEEEARDMRR